MTEVPDVTREGCRRDKAVNKTTYIHKVQMTVCDSLLHCLLLTQPDNQVSNDANPDSSREVNVAFQPKFDIAAPPEYICNKKKTIKCQFFGQIFNVQIFVCKVYVIAQLQTYIYHFFTATFHSTKARLLRDKVCIIQKPYRAHNKDLLIIRSKRKTS